MEIVNKIVVVSGASNDIGESIAKDLQHFLFPWAVQWLMTVTGYRRQR